MSDPILLSPLNLFLLSLDPLVFLLCSDSIFLSPFLQGLKCQTTFLVLLPLSIQILFHFMQLQRLPLQQRTGGLSLRP